MKQISVVLVVLVSLASIALASEASGSVKVVAKCNTHSASKRPTSFVFACADAGLQASNLSWRTWGGNRAKALGTIDYKVCEPDCASGHFVNAPGKVTLYNKVRCHKRKFRYSRVRIKIFGSDTYKFKIQSCA